MSSCRSISRCEHARRGGGIVGVVAIDQDIDVGFDIGEHAADDVAFALQALAPHDRAGRPRLQHRMVGGVVVVDVDHGVRQRPLEVRHDLADRGFLVSARDQHRNAGLIHDQTKLSTIDRVRLRTAVRSADRSERVRTDCRHGISMISVTSRCSGLICVSHPQHRDDGAAYDPQVASRGSRWRCIQDRCRCRRSSFSSVSVSPRQPRTWASPVMPGLTLWRAA